MDTMPGRRLSELEKIYDMVNPDREDIYTDAFGLSLNCGDFWDAFHRTLDYWIDDYGVTSPVILAKAWAAYIESGDLGVIERFCLASKQS